MLASFLYCCRQCCGQFELDQPLFRGLELDDIVLEENYDDRQGLLESRVCIVSFISFFDHVDSSIGASP